DDGKPFEGVQICAPIKRGNVFQDLLDGYPVAGSASAVVARRELLLQFNGFDESLAHSEDTDVWLKLARIGELDYVAAPLVGVREHAASVQRRPNPRRRENDFLSRLYVLEKWVGAAEPGRELLGAYRTEAAAIGLARLMSRFEFGFYAVMRDRAPRI